MIIDYLNVLADAQALTTTGATTNVIDQLAAGQALPQGITPVVEFLIDTTVAASGGANTTVFSVQDSADNVTFTDIVVAPSVAKAVLVAGYVTRLPIPAGCRRYIRGYVTMTTNDWTSGKLDCRVVLDTDRTVDRSL